MLRHNVLLETGNDQMKLWLPSAHRCCALAGIGSPLLRTGRTAINFAATGQTWIATAADSANFGVVRLCSDSQQINDLVQLGADYLCLGHPPLSAALSS
jgi:hypothetical protein